ncbi:MAG: amidohydrolase family protein, partial [Chitinophagaceae bacterium]
FIYPSFIDLYSDYGLPAVTRQASAYNYLQPAQLTSNQKGAYGWNQAIRTEVDASRLFTVDESRAKPLRDVGFGTVLSHQKDGIARGTGVIVTLANQKENQVILKERASAHYSLNKGSSQQSYPSSMMGSIALLRQTYLDAAWYKGNPVKEGVNLTLKYWNEQQSFPQIFEANDKWNDLRADRIGDEFGVQYIIKGGQNEYQRIQDIKATRANYILPLNFPSALDVDDPAELRFIAVDELKHWELAPTSPAAFEKAEIPFSLTTADLSTPQEFTGNLKKAIDEGLSVAKALDALTKNPASWLGIYDQVGSLNAGKLANFIITSGRLFHEKTVIYQNWVQGEKYVVKEEGWQDSKGTYTLQLNGTKGAQTFSLQLKEGGSVTVLVPDTLTGK